MQGDFNDGVEISAQVIEALAKRIMSRPDASRAKGFVAALEAVAQEIRGLKQPGSALSVGTLSLAKLDIREAS